MKINTDLNTSKCLSTLLPSKQNTLCILGIVMGITLSFTGVFYMEKKFSRISSYIFPNTKNKVNTIILKKKSEQELFLEQYPLDLSLCDILIEKYKQNPDEYDNICNTNQYKMIQSYTPVGSVFMKIDYDTFVYWSDNTIPTKFLQVVARKYVHMMDDMDIFARSVYHNRKNNEEFDYYLKHERDSKNTEDEHDDYLFLKRDIASEQNSVKSNSSETNLLYTPLFRRIGKIRDLELSPSSHIISNTTTTNIANLSYNEYVKYVK